MDIKKYEIVRLTAKDLPGCASFWYIDDRRLHERAIFAYKAEGEYLGGFALFERYEKCGHFSHFFVRSDLRGNGIGGKMLEFAVEYLKNAGMEVMRLHVSKDNAPTIRLYRKFGFDYAGDAAPDKAIFLKPLL